MFTKTTGLIVAVVGVLVALFFALLDVIGVGSTARFGYIQITGVVVGVLILIAGLVIYLRGDRS